ncbi:hypothetical protein JJV70_13765 [Streptomyces sp. JJ66]|uniref:hypothetical protein n=1 Tax=Streptomyces sp. JJ66 TaxID=2803843 RepID=UPI001C562439|nr:hypothetical protein [Streptomyces sp. JJ66]MBW1603151.1 hypothetical protein [Streptomyces sp. JJ66]
MSPARTGAALALAATALCAVAIPAAVGAGSVVVTPAKTHPGGKVNIRVDACDGDKALARSKAFVATVALHNAADATLSGDASIRKDAEPGAYRVTIDCYDKTGNLKSGIAEGSVTVRADKPYPAPTQREHHREPHAPVKAGGGGTAGEPGDGASPAALGVAAALAGLAGAAVLRRRALARRGTDG